MPRNDKTWKWICHYLRSGQKHTALPVEDMDSVGLSNQ